MIQPAKKFKNALQSCAAYLDRPDVFRQNVLVVLGIAIVLRLAILGLFWSDWTWQSGHVHDNWDKLAVNLVESGTFGFEPDKPTVIRAPLFPLFEIPIYQLFGLDYRLWSLTLLAFDVLVCAMLILLGRRAWGQRAALLAGLFYAIHLALIYYTARIEQFVVSLPLVFLWLYFYTRIEKRPRAKWLAFSLGLVCGLLMINKSVYLPAPFLAAGALIWARRTKISLRTRVSNAAIVLVTAAAIVAPWTVRNYVVTGGRIIPVQSLLAYQFFLDVQWDELDAQEGTHRPDFSHWNKIYTRQMSFIAENEKLSHPNLTGVQRELMEEDICREMLLPWIKNHPAQLISKSIKNMWQFWFGAENFRKTSLFYLLQFFYLGLSLFGTYHLFKNRGLSNLGIGVLLILALWAEHSLVYAMGRHSMDLIPILALLFGLGTDVWLRRLQEENRDANFFENDTLRNTGTTRNRTSKELTC